MSLKDLQFYIDNPDQLPDDPADLAKIQAMMAGDTGEASEQGDNTATPGGEEEPKAAEAAKVDEQAGKPSEEADVLSRDGKHTIPYSVLQTERERRQAAETAVDNLTRRVEEIQAQLAKGTQAGDTKAAEAAEAAVGDLDPEELEAIREDFPVFGKVLDKLMGTVSSLTDKVTELQGREAERETEVATEASKVVQDYIDAEPLLAYLQTKDPANFQKAIALDNELRSSPKWGDLATRFAKVASMMDDLHGPFDGYTAPTKTSTPDKASVPDKDAARKAVAEKVKQTKVVPTSLSDIPAGEPPESNEMEALENASPAEIGARLMKMTEEQRTQFLNRL